MGVPQILCHRTEPIAKSKYFMFCNLGIQEDKGREDEGVHLEHSRLTGRVV